MTTATPPRRRRGTGTIERTADGWAPRLPSNGARLAPQPTYEQAATLLDAAIAVLAEGVAHVPGGVTLVSLGEEVVSARESRRLGSASADRTRFDRHIATAPFARWPVSSITTPDVVTWLERLEATRAAPGHGHRSRPRRALARSTISSVLTLLRVIFGRAVRLGMIPVSPVVGVTQTPAPASPEEPWTYLTPEEQRRLLGCQSVPRDWRLLIAFALGTGMRQGEVWNLELRDVDLDARRVTVRYGSRDGATKGKRIRRIPLFGLALDALTEQLARLRGRPNPCGLAWPLADGGRRARGEPSWWRAALAEAGIITETRVPVVRTGKRGPRPMTRPVYSAPQRPDEQVPRWHDLRHTAASSLVAGWWGRRWSLQETKELLGHRSVTTTERYAHLAGSVLEAAGADTSPTWLPELGAPQASGKRSKARTRWPQDGPRGGEETGANYWSHLRDLNSRPTVYETVDVPLLGRAVGPDLGAISGLSQRARAALVAIADGRPEGWRLAIALLAEIGRLGEDVDEEVA